MSECKKICDVDLVIDPNNLWDLNLLDFCFNQLDAGFFKHTPLGNGFDLDEDAFEVMWISSLSWILNANITMG